MIQPMTQIEDEASNSLIRDLTHHWKTNPRAKAYIDRYYIDKLPTWRAIKFRLLLGLFPREHHRDVPYGYPTLVTELLRRGNHDR